MDINRQTLREDWEETQDDIRDGFDVTADRAREVGQDLQDFLTDDEPGGEEERRGLF